MARAGIAINATMFATLVWIDRMPHRNIGAFIGADNFFGRFEKKLCLESFLFHVVRFALFKTILCFQETIGRVGLRPTAFVINVGHSLTTEYANMLGSEKKAKKDVVYWLLIFYIKTIKLYLLCRWLKLCAFNHLNLYFSPQLITRLGKISENSRGETILPV
jgi:hypothetical protein